MVVLPHGRRSFQPWSRVDRHLCHVAHVQGRRSASAAAPTQASVRNSRHRHGPGRRPLVAARDQGQEPEQVAARQLRSRAYEHSRDGKPWTKAGLRNPATSLRVAVPLRICRREKKLSPNNPGFPAAASVQSQSTRADRQSVRCLRRCTSHRRSSRAAWPCTGPVPLDWSSRRTNLRCRPPWARASRSSVKRSSRAIPPYRPPHRERRPRTHRDPRGLGVPEFRQLCGARGHWPDRRSLRLVEAERRDKAGSAPKPVTSSRPSPRGSTPVGHGEGALRNRERPALDPGRSLAGRPEPRRTGHAPHNLGRLQQVALNLLRQDATFKAGEAIRHHKADRSLTYRETVPDLAQSCDCPASCRHRIPGLGAGVQSRRQPP